MLHLELGKRLGIEPDGLCFIRLQCHRLFKGDIPDFSLQDAFYARQTVVLHDDFRREAGGSRIGQWKFCGHVWILHGDLPRGG